MIRVLLVGDHALFRQALTFVFRCEPDIAVVGQAGSLAEAGRMLEQVDVAIVDLALPDGSGIELVPELRAANPQGAVLILTASLNRRVHARALAAGAAGVLPKSVEIDDVLGAVRRLAAGAVSVPRRELLALVDLVGRQQVQDQARELPPRQLTRRERQVLQALAEGLSDKGIAQRLTLRPQTARNHMLNILGKLGVHSRVQALVVAARDGIITIR